MIDITKSPEDMWQFLEHMPVYVLPHTFGNEKIYFFIQPEDNIFSLSNERNLEWNILPSSLIEGFKINNSDISAIQNMIENSIKQIDKKNYDLESKYGFSAFMDHVDSCVGQFNNEYTQLETAKKAGHVQGVCECVAILGDNHDLAKKLMTETGVTKDIAKKFANPETYKALEQGIFAPKQEQQFEQTQGEHSRERGVKR